MRCTAYETGARDVVFEQTERANMVADFRCDDCCSSFHDPDLTMAPMLHDRVWRRLARPHETLCGECMFKPAADRRIKLTLADLRPCPANLELNQVLEPLSWFEFFAKDEAGPPKNLSQWVDALEQPTLVRWLLDTSFCDLPD